MNYCVYAIGKKLIDPYEECYIGVTNNPQRRWDSHCKSEYTVGKYIRKYNLTFEDNFVIIFEGSDEECFDIENKYRPFPLMGLNEASGGHGGHTKYSEERNKRLSNSMKGRNVHWGHKISETRKSKKIAQGEKNPNAKTWYLKDPSNNEYVVTGAIDEFCEKNKLLMSSLRYYKGNRVPPLAKNSYGGYREKIPGTKELRENTTNWVLFDVKK